MKKERAEMPPDEAAEAQARAERRAKKEAKAEKARARAKKSYQRRKEREKGTAEQTSAPPEAEEAAPPAEDAGPIGSIVEDEQGAGGRGAAEEGPASAVLNGPEELAKALANLQRTGVVMAAKFKQPRLARVVLALQWSDARGQPTEQCSFGCALAWPWIEENGLATLDDVMTPGVMALFGAALLLGPAIAQGMQEWDDHQREQAEAKKGPAGAGEKAAPGGKVIDAEFKREEAA